MQGMANQIVDQDRAAAHAQRLVGKAHQFGGLQVMCEQAAADQIETRVREGKCESVGDHGAVSGQQVRGHAIEESYVDRDSLARQLLARNFRHLAESSGHFQHREMLASRRRGDAFDHIPCRRDSAEPAVDAG